MKITKYIMITCLFAILTSCGDKQLVEVEFDKIDGLSDEAFVYHKGFKVGEVDNLKISSSGNIIVTLQLDKDYKLPEFPVFKIFSRTMISYTKSVEILASNDSNNIPINMTYYGYYENKSFFDSVSVNTNEMIENLLQNSNNQDSLLIELRRLNENLEKIKN